MSSILLLLKQFFPKTGKQQVEITWQRNETNGDFQISVTDLETKKITAEIVMRLYQ